MPKVALTKEQRESQQVKAISVDILGALNADRGRRRLTNERYAQESGISLTCWNNWNRGMISSATLGKLVVALSRAGCELRVVPKGAKILKEDSP